MAYNIVDPNSALLAHLASVDVKFSGVHIGGGIYFSANHNPSPGGTSTAIAQRSLAGEGEAHATTEIDFTLPDGGDPWDEYRDDIDNDGNLDFVKAGFDMAMHVGESLPSTGVFYTGPAAPMLIAMDPGDLAGTVTITGFPNAGNSLNGEDGVMHESTGTLAGYSSESVNGDTGGYFTVDDTQAVNGMSGGGNFLDFDADGDGSLETYVIGTTARSLYSAFPLEYHGVQTTAFSAHYDDLAAAIEGLSGAEARGADDFGRMALLSGQSLFSSATNVQGEFFHEDLFGSINADTMDGGGGNDRLYGRANSDLLSGGDGDDLIDGGAGADTMTGGAGSDTFKGFGGATDEITDFSGADGDILDLSDFFLTLEDVRDASTENGDGSLDVDLSQGTEPGAAQGGTVRLLSTGLADLTPSTVMVVCFAAGTRIDALGGRYLVERLRPGQQVRLECGRYAPVMSMARRRVTKDEMRETPSLRPVRIAAGSLGSGLPERDLVVSPQHRLLVDGPLVMRMTGNSAALIPAVKLVGHAGITRGAACDMTYVHILLAEHHVIFANGCRAESFLPGPEALASLPPVLSREYRALVPAARRPAYPIFPGAKAPRLLKRCRRNGHDLQQAILGTAAA